MNVPLVVFLIVVGMGVAGCDGGADRRVLKLAHGLPESHPVHRAMVFMGERLKALSDDHLRLQIYPSQQLGTERECLELLQIGSLSMTKVSAAVMEAFAPGYRIFNLPYLFEDEAHRSAVLTGPIGRQVLLEGEEYWLRGLCYYDAGSRSFYTVNRPVRTPDDLRGLKIRTQESPTAFALVRAMGGSATPIAWGELYSALQQGVVDGAENNPPSFYLSRHYEVCRYYTLNEHTAVPDVLLIGTKAWRTLTPRQQVWLELAAAESARYQAELWKESTALAMAAIEAAGVEVIHPDKARFAQVVADLAEAYREDPAVYGLIQRIRGLRPSVKGGE
jgi:tripartite ATP-independent transporter DctP family solute receptor